MKPIQFILIPLLAGILFFFQARLQKHPLLRVMVSLALIAAIIFTLFQDSSTLIANFLGIGRGVDLVIYLSLIGLTVSCVLLYLRTVKLERMLTMMARNQAIKGVDVP